MTKKIKIFLFGEAKRGENIINKQPTFSVTLPEKKPDWNRWTWELQVSSNNPKTSYFSK